MCVYIYTHTCRVIYTHTHTLIPSFFRIFPPVKVRWGPDDGATATAWVAYQPLAETVSEFSH